MIYKIDFFLQFELDRILKVGECIFDIGELVIVIQ